VTGKARCVIIDIDGTIAKIARTGDSPLRVETRSRGHFDWERVGEDEPVSPVIDIIQAVLYNPDQLGNEDEIFPVFVTGRMEQCRDLTAAWLNEHFLRDWYGEDVPPLLFMRPDGDFRPDWQLKQEIYDQHIKDEYEVICVFDDRDVVVQMWRRNGLLCLQVANGDF
jgi:hypothetical protein